MDSMEVPGGGGPYGFVYRSIGGSGKRSPSFVPPPRPKGEYNPPLLQKQKFMI